MTTSQAAKYFLDNVCRSNKLTIPLDAAFEAKPVDFTTAHDAAAVYRDGLASTAKQLASPPLAWPQAVQPDVNAFVTALYGDVSSIGYIAQQTTLTGLINAWNTAPATTAGSPAAAIRIKLDLPSDAKASCGM